jgi:cob(I)alamin adenosyltransferase
LPSNSSSNRWYSGSGDDGYTQVISNERIPKHDLRLEALGQVDELQAFLGVCRAGPLSNETKSIVLTIERHLYQLMAELAFPPTNGKFVTQIEAHHIDWLEEQTDKLGESIPAFTDFVVPGDSQAGAIVNLARAVARRVERTVVHLIHAEESPSIATRYLNRLSSLLFVMACYEDMQADTRKPSAAQEP